MKTLVTKITKKVIKKSPEILFVAGTIGVGVTTVLACKGTLKAKEVVDNAKEDFETIEQAVVEQEMHPEEELYSDTDYKKDKIMTYVKTGKGIVKSYAPAVIMGAVSLFCFYKSHDILSKRNLALGSTLAFTLKEFDYYRGEITKRFGSEVDHEIRNHVVTEEVVEIVEGKNGKTKEEKKIVKKVDMNSLMNDPSVIIFNPKDVTGTDNRTYNKNHIMSAINSLNYINNEIGEVWLSDIYNALGLNVPKKFKQESRILGVTKKDGDVDLMFIDRYGTFVDRYNRDYMEGMEDEVILRIPNLRNIWVDFDNEEDK